MSSQEAVKVRRDKVEACLTCPLCNNLLNEATTISLCLHTFCRNCIYKKLADEDVDCCPVCDINLGCTPVDKLRPDCNLQNIVAKIFLPDGSEVGAPEVAPSVSPSAKGKEKMSSLVVSTPRVSMQDGVTGRRARAGVRKGSASRGASPATKETPKKEDDSMEDRLDGSNSPEPLNNIIQKKKQISSAKSSHDQIHGEHLENRNESQEGKVDLWKPLNTLVEAATSYKFSESQGLSHVKSNPPCSGNADMSMIKARTEENKQKAAVQDDKSSFPTVPGPAKLKKLRRRAVVKEARRDWKDGPVWFELVASVDHGGEALPQVSVPYIKVKDGNMPVSHIQKYIAMKLELASEEEVQIFCLGQPVMPDLNLSNLLDAWVCTSANRKKVRAYVGDSAEKFVMPLSYSRKVAAPTS